MVWRMFRWGALLGLGALAACGGGSGGDAASGGDGTLQFDLTPVSVSATVGGASPVAYSTVRGSGLADRALYEDITYTKNGLASVQLYPDSGSTARLQMDFKPPSGLAPGVYNDTVLITVCFDPVCAQPMQGSPFTVNTSYTVLASSDSGTGNSGGGSAVTPQPVLPELAVASRVTLTHDVVDAEFSKPLNAVIMVSSWPTPALYIYDAASGVETQRALSKVPKAVSISPDGLWAAVGHDELVSYLRLDNRPVATKLLNVSAVVGDLVLDGAGAVHVFPQAHEWSGVHSIDTAGNAERVQYGTYGGTRVRLHPDGTSIYGANNGLSPDDIERYSITAGAAAKLRDSPYHGVYFMCGNLWFSVDGGTIITACGKTFRSSTDATLDMRYTGGLELSAPASAYYGYRIVSLSQYAVRGEIALLEHAVYECTSAAASVAIKCVSYFNVYDGDSLLRTHRYSIPPVAVDGTNYAQRGLHVFHRNDNARVLITRLNAMPNKAQEYLLSVVR
jgi:hypothetical protein